MTVNQPTTGDTTAVVCESFTWDGTTYTVSGDYTTTKTNVNGCDSVIMMTLTVNPTYTVTDVRSICPSELPYTWNGVVFDAAGTQTLNLQTINGCDSVVTMTLTVNPSVSSEISVTCPDSCYIWNGQSYCASGDYTQTLQTSQGCDSVVTLHLTITVGIDDHDGFALKVYPNPTNGVVNVEWTINNVQTETLEIRLYDAYGRLLDVAETFHETSLPTAQIDLSKYAYGTYFVKAVADGKVVAVRKVVKQ